MVDQVIPPPPTGYNVIDSPSQANQASAVPPAPPVSVSSDNIPPPPAGYNIVDDGTTTPPAESTLHKVLVGGNGPGNIIGNAVGGQTGAALNAVGQFSQDIGEAANKTVNDLYGHLSQIPPELYHLATDPPKNSIEALAHMVGGTPALSSVRAASSLVQAAKNMYESTGENYQQSKQKFNDALAYFHAGDYKNAAASAGTATGASLGMVPGPGQMVGEPVKAVSESLRPNAPVGSTSKAAAQTAVDAATALIMGKAPEIMENVAIVPKAVGETAGDILGKRAAGKVSQASSEDLIAANQDFKKAIPATKTNPYTDNDLVVANNYLEPQHANVEPIRSVQHTVDALNSSVEGIENKVSDNVKLIPNEPIKTNVLGDVKSALEKNERGEEFVNSGMKEIEGLNLKDVTMDRADAVRRQLNLENKAILKKNNYDLAAARAADPGFAAREAAAESLRNGIYDQLEAHGIEGVRELRQEEGSLLKVRDAAQAQIFNGDKTIKGSGGGSLARRLIGRSAQAASTALGAGGGAAVGGVGGAMVGGALGAGLGEEARQAIVPPDLTRDEMIERRFGKQVATGEPGGVTVNLHAPETEETPVGTQQTIPPPIPPATSGQPVQPSLFGHTSTVNPTKATGESAQGSDLNLESRYRVPTENALEIPVNMRNPGELSRDTHIAEWGHVTNGALESFETKGIKSHLHPTLKGTNANAAAGFKTGIDFKDPEAVQRNSGRLLSTIMGHAAAQELHSGIPVEINPSIDGDIDRLQKLGEILGLSDEEIEGAARYGLDRAKRNLTEPGISDKLLENVDKREPGLDPTMHASPERTEAYGEEVRRIRDENRSGQAESGVRGNNAGDAGRTSEAGKTVDTGTEGKGPEGNPDRNQEVASEAVEDAKKSGGGFVADMRTGKPTDTGFLVEMMPEKRQTLDHDVTPKDIQKFYNDNRQLFKQHPELRIGGYKNELNISAHTDDQLTAERLAKKLDQRSVWDVKAGKEIPIGGKGETKEFKDYPFDKRIKELRGKGKE